MNDQATQGTTSDGSPPSPAAQCSAALWRIRRLHKGSGKARWHTIATGLSEYLAKTWCRDSNAGSRNWHYETEVEPPNDQAQRPEANDD